MKTNGKIDLRTIETAALLLAVLWLFFFSGTGWCQPSQEMLIKQKPGTLKQLPEKMAPQKLKPIQTKPVQIPQRPLDTQMQKLPQAPPTPEAAESLKDQKPIHRLPQAQQPNEPEGIRPPGRGRGCFVQTLASESPPLRILVLFVGVAILLLTFTGLLFKRPSQVKGTPSPEGDEEK